MSINNITPYSSYSFVPVVSNIDSEEKEIMARLRAYGVAPTGDKATDKAKLRKIEIEKAKQDNYVSNKYLTVSEKEFQEIQDKKKSLKKLGNKNSDIANTKKKHLGAELMGEQVLLAIKMKSLKDKYKINNYDEYAKIKSIS